VLLLMALGLKSSERGKEKKKRKEIGRNIKIVY
jgi:hypothetical protein